MFAVSLIIKKGMDILKLIVLKTCKMKDKKFKFLAIFISYSFFIFLIILSVNAVIPERELLVLEQNGKLIEKVDNKFLRNQNSVYEILEEDESSSNEEKLSQNTESTEKMSILTDNGKIFSTFS